MAKSFPDLKLFANHIRKVAANYHAYETKAANISGPILVESAKQKIGHLQPEVWDFEKWAPLAESTKRDKERKDYVFNEEYNPLFRTGELRDSISYVFYNRKLFLYSTSPIMIYQELGTVYIPPRSVLGATMYVKGTELTKTIFQKMLVNWISDNEFSLRGIS